MIEGRLVVAASHEVVRLENLVYSFAVFDPLKESYHCVE